MSDETVGTRLTTLRCVHDDNGIPCAWCCETADLIDAAVADLVQERDGQLAVAEQSRENAGKWLTAYQDAFAEARALATDNARLRGALAKYGAHLDQCAVQLAGNNCTCGLRALVATPGEIELRCRACGGVDDSRTC